MGGLSWTVPWNGGQEHNGRTVAYFHPKDVGLYHFGVCPTPSTLFSILRLNRSDSSSCLYDITSQSYHPMKAYRLTLTNELVLGYGLHNYMQVHAPRKATEEEIERFHSSDYVDYLSR